ncbi:MAG: MGH1-like glycoside hydrolase domain-containing protein [Dongiaceae bacterium]
MQPSEIAAGRAWNSWSSEFPAEMIYLPLGLCITPCAYTSSKGSFTRFPAGDSGVKLGPRAIDGSEVHLDLEHAGTMLRFSYSKPDHDVLRGGWEAKHLAEWGLRFWIVMVVRLPSADRSGELVEWTYNPTTGELSAIADGRRVCIRGERVPLAMTFHDSIDALQLEFETKGYFCLESRGKRGRVAALRYHLEEMPRFQFAVAVADDHDSCRRRLNAALAASATPPGLPRQTGNFKGGLDAIRDVIGWNTVWDAANRRPYTSLSRNWVSQKFGGWGVWLNDVLYHALMASLFDPQVARENLRAVFAGATPQGNLPCLLTGRDAWVDRSQPPICAFIVWLIFLRTHDRDMLAESYEVLRRNHDWWWATRDGNGDGLVEYGTSPVGDGLYRGTKLAAKDESSMDNSPTHDEATLDAGSWTLDCADVGLNSLLALDGEMLGKIADALGKPDDAARYSGLAAQLNERIRTRLWDESRQVFANRLWSGKFVRSLAPPSFYPLLSGGASPEQAAAMIKLLHDPRKFGGTWLLPSTTRDDPAFPDNVYWRGRVWPPLNFLVWHGLKRHGMDAEASRLADNGFQLFNAEWRQRRCPENYNAVTGEALDQPDTDSFYGWGALLPYLAVAEMSDVNPWNGWEVVHGAGDQFLGPFVTPIGETTIYSQGEWLNIFAGSDPVLRSTVPGRFRGIELRENGVTLGLPAVPANDSKRWLALPAIQRSAIAIARLGDRPLEPELTADGDTMFRLPPTKGPETFVLSAASNRPAGS